MLRICCWTLELPSGLSLQAFGSMSSKKRKQPDVDTLEHERTMHGSFVSAANSISQLYTQAVHQQRRAQIEGARAALVGSSAHLWWQPCKAQQDSQGDSVMPGPL